MRHFAFFTSALVFSSAAALGCGDSTGSTSGTSSTGGGGTGGATASSTSSTGGAGPTPLGCVGNVDWPAPTAAMVTISYYLVTDADSHPGIPDLIVKACSKTDATCATPVATGTSDANGAGSVDVPSGASGFDGYLHVTSPSGVVDPIVPTRIFWTQPISDDATVGAAQNLFTAGSFATKTGLAGVTLDPAKAYVVVDLRDCLGDPTEDATATVDGGTEDAFYRNGSFVPGVNFAPSFFDVTPGQNDVVGTVIATGETFGETTVTTALGELTYVLLPPTPLN